MRRVHAKRGSALLIVLGMMAFLVISAVSFAIYMRDSRKPSSYLRRVASSRYLLKAALANAVASIDGRLDTSTGLVEGIYDDPYPGVGPSLNNALANNGDFWDHRVFTPFGPADEEFTVSTMTLEALAYLPPAIINEVRIYSRKTRTAEWHNLAFDTGRYAFCAVDVSDCFDINKVYANDKRRTSAPSRRPGKPGKAGATPTVGPRVNLSSLFTADVAKGLDQKLLEAVRSETVPSFISLADFNLFSASRDDRFAPFMRFLGQTESQIYNQNDHTTVSNALFITDTWFPPTNCVGKVRTFDLCGGAQPFAKNVYKQQEKANVLSLDTSNNNTDFARAMLKYFHGPSLMCLYDYLDPDSVPLSLCVPTVEVAPMIAGLGLAHGGQVMPKLTEVEVRLGTYDSGKKDVKKQPILYYRRARKYALTSIGNAIALSGVSVYPFKRTAEKGYESNFKVEVLVKILFGEESFPSRVDVNSSIYPADKWKADVSDGIITVEPASGNLVANQNIQKMADACSPWNAPVKLMQALKKPMPAFWVVEEAEDAEFKTPIGKPYCSLDGIWNAAEALIPYDEKGQKVSWWPTQMKDDRSDQWPAAGAAVGSWGDIKPNQAPANMAAKPFVPHVLVWAKVTAKGDDKNAVDMVPARITDDHYWGDKKLSLAEAKALTETASICTLFGKGTPVLEFRGEREFTFSTSDDPKSAITVLDGKTPEPFSKWWDRLYAPDPRYNFAPENWIAQSGGNGEAKAADWLDVVTPLLGQDGRDPDIFMATSDQEYMQSIGEMAFIPCLQDLHDRRGAATSPLFSGTYTDAMVKGLDGAGMDKRVGAAGLNNLGCRDFMWLTYSPFEDDLYTLKDENGNPSPVIAGSGDFRVNPYSPDPRVMAAVVRGTPYDYYAASTNEEYGLGNVPAENASFGPKCNVAVLTDGELDGIASGLRRAFEQSARNLNVKSGANMDWTQAYNQENLWFDGAKGDEQLEFCGTQLKHVLHGVDRKFLYSFWRECFQNRQQLFLVFIRAEPLTVGGMGIGSLAAAQLGARGVALVWRDPMPPAKGRTERRARNQLSGITNWRNQSEQSGPHRTRVLFYHQFD